MSTSGPFAKDGPGPLWSSGPTPGYFHRFPSSQCVSGMEATKRIAKPKIVGGSVLGMRFRDGAVIAADMLGSFGTLKKFKSCTRLFKVNESTVFGAAGDYANFQFLTDLIEQQVIVEECINDGFGFSPQSLHCCLTRLLYSRRSQFLPLWNTIIVAGWEDYSPFVGYIDMKGTAYEAPSVACGFGDYLAQPLMREELERKPNLSKEEAVKVIHDCMKVLCYRDAQTVNKYQLAVITRDGVDMQGPIMVQTNWAVANMVEGYE